MQKYTLGQTREQVLELIDDKSIKLVQLGPNRICIARIKEEFFAFERLCPHQNAPLNQGFVTGNAEVVCPLHAFRFDLKSGQVRSGHCGDLKIFQTKLGPKGLEIFL